MIPIEVAVRENNPFSEAILEHGYNPFYRLDIPDGISLQSIGVPGKNYKVLVFKAAGSGRLKFWTVGEWVNNLLDADVIYEPGEKVYG